MATHTVGGRHDFAAEAANQNMKTLTVQLYCDPGGARHPTSQGSVPMVVLFSACLRAGPSSFCDIWFALGLALLNSRNTTRDDS